MTDMIEFQDKSLVCKDCAKEFIFTAGEQKFFALKKFYTPVRCKECRIKRKVGVQTKATSGLQNVAVVKF